MNEMPWNLKVEVFISASDFFFHLKRELVCMIVRIVIARYRGIQTDRSIIWTFVFNTLVWNNLIDNNMVCIAFVTIIAYQIVG